ncbi:Integrase core domain containing protein [Trichostrongylus colubriformis]|uniref:Integrase core domain containing protein n=1 Tax=Trichostrongylus colubriformis TaxID=6319 RepID=A0AAN8FWJ2_TRICO
MPSLLPKGVNRSRPFQNIGLDYLDPLRHKDAYNTTSKVWVSLFTYMSTRATLTTLDHFWTVWLTDYLNALAQRITSRIRQGKSTPRRSSVGAVVLVADKQLPRGQWNIAVITELTRDSQGVVRSATVRLPNGNHVQRSINHLYPLEIDTQRATHEDSQDTPTDTLRSRPSRIQPPESPSPLTPI